MVSTISPATNHFGSALADAGDTDGDGVADIAVGDRGTSPDGTNHQHGAIGIISGATGNVLRQVHGGPWDRLGTSVAAIGDVDGDGLEDILGGGPSWMNAASSGLGTAVIVRACGAARYGEGLGGVQTLALDHTADTLNLSGGAAFSTGSIVASIAQDQFLFMGVPILVDATPGAFAAFPVTLNSAGGLTAPLPLLQPALLGHAIYLQAFEFSAASPLNVFVSNGLELLFCGL